LARRLVETMKIHHVLVRQHVDLSRFEESVRFYEGLFNEEARLRLTPVEGALHVAQVASVLLVGVGADMAGEMPDVRSAFLVDKLEDVVRDVVAQGARLVEAITTIETGQYALIRHPDGLLVEYVEHTRKNPQDFVLSE
jgi:predicted enzyme related to lactoylglutathione lyase